MAHFNTFLFYFAYAPVLSVGACQRMATKRKDNTFNAMYGQWRIEF